MPLGGNCRSSSFWQLIVERMHYKLHNWKYGYISEEGYSLGKAEDSLFSPLEKSEIPQHLHSIVDACGIVLR